MAKVSKEVAGSEIERWLDYKKSSEAQRVSYADQIEQLSNAIESGDLVLNEDFSFTYKLKFDTGGEEPVKELKFKPRISIGSLQKSLEGVKTSDADGRITAYIAALTGQPKGVIRALDTADYSIPQAIVVFFL
jgi:hypothetical protein